MEMEPQEVLRLEFGEDVPTPFRKVLNTIQQTSTSDKIQDPRKPEILGDSEILGGSIDKTGEDDIELSFDYEHSLRQGRLLVRSSRRTQIKDEESRLEKSK